MTRSVAAVLVGLTLGACASPPTSFRAAGAGVQRGDTLAVLPLVNLSQEQNAPDIVMNALVVELLEAERFVVVDPGRVHEMVLQRRLRLTDRLPLETLEEIQSDIGTRYVMAGTVNAFGMVNDGGEMYPSVSVTLRLVRCDDGSIVWAGSHARRGDDTESVFGMGRVRTLERLTQIVVADLVKTMEHRNR